MIKNEPRKEYNCTRCGLPKRGHVCPMVIFMSFLVDCQADAEENTLDKALATVGRSNSGRMTRRTSSRMRGQMKEDEQDASDSDEEDLIASQLDEFDLEDDVDEETKKLKKEERFNRFEIFGSFLIQNRAVNQAVDFNAKLLHWRKSQGPFYFDPHTCTTQVIGSWAIKLPITPGFFPLSTFSSLRMDEEKRTIRIRTRRFSSESTRRTKKTSRKTKRTTETQVKNLYPHFLYFLEIWML
jgi:hypothetical protein